MITPTATELDSSSAMIVSVRSSVFSRSHMIAKATSRLTKTIGHVGSLRPNQKPSATPVSAAWEIVSLKNAMRRAVTNTPRNAQSGPRKSAASSARCMKGSLNMRREKHQTPNTKHQISSKHQTPTSPRRTTISTSPTRPSGH